MPATLTRLPALPREAEPANLIDRLLAEQKQLQTPVARFSETHARRAPDLADHYRSLIPLTRPGSGEQYAFEVSLDRCTGCKACVSACHSLNGLDDGEAWRDTGTLLGGPAAPGWQQTVTTACHHCEDPGCLGGCPVGAYEKDAETGIVRHLDDQCIGCSYCILKCPYDVPKFSKKRGIVRKCDMCHQRLAEGEAPACVQACPTQAIRIVAVPKSAPAPEISPLLGNTGVTRPVTRYVGRAVPTTAFAADRAALVPEHAHWPLVFMLLFTQAGLGLLLGSGGEMRLTFAGAGLFFAGMAASVFHLGKPHKAWRFFLGLRTSWLSREILAFSMFAPIPLVLAARPFLGEWGWVASLAAVSAWPLGLAAVFTSVMIYQDTHRPFWRFTLGAARFFGTVACFGLLAHAVNTPTAALACAAAILLKMIPEAHLISAAGADDWSPDLHSARLQTGPLGRVMRARIIVAFAAGFCVLVQPWLALPILLLAELAERQLFFQAVHAPRMAGNFGPAG